MLTNVGKFLRKLRIDQGEILKDMADKLNVTSSFLSAVENGKKKMPSSWNKLICDFYHLDDKQQNEFTKAIAESEERLEINLSNSSQANKELAIVFARKFSDFDEQQVKKLNNILKETKN